MGSIVEKLDLSSRQTIVYVSPLLITRYSGSEEQSLRAYRAIKRHCNVRVICFSKRRAHEFLASNTLKRILMLFCLALRYRLVRFFSREKLSTDVCILWGLHALLCLPLLGLSGACRKIATERQWSSQTESRIALYKWFNVSEWFFNSKFVMEQFLARSVADKAMVIHNDKRLEIGVLAKFQYTNKGKWGVICRVSQEKSIERAIDIISNLGISELHIFGPVESSSYARFLTDYAHKKSVEISFHGKRPKSEVYGTLCVVINTGEGEGMPNSLLESIIARKIVISIATPYLEEILFPSVAIWKSDSEISKIGVQDFEHSRKKIVEEFSYD